MPVLVLITRVIHRSKLHFAVAWVGGTTLNGAKKVCPRTKINLCKARLCCAELNLEIKFNKSTGETQLLDQTYELSSASN